MSTVNQRGISLLERVSLTGPDDKTSILGLEAMVERYPFVELALLYVPHNEGAPRNPTSSWRHEFFMSDASRNSAVHLCGSAAFQQLLNNELPAEIAFADRVQLNVNARSVEFSDDQVLEIFNRSLDIGPSIILQYHSASKVIIEKFILSLSPVNFKRVHCLSDASKGTGLAPELWDKVPTPPGSFNGFAGGLGPGSSLDDALRSIASRGVPFWIDMETNIRTNNEFDFEKSNIVLAQCDEFMRK